MKKVKLIRERLHASKSMQKCYVDYKRYSSESNVGDHVFLEVSPIKKVMRFGIRWELNPRHVGSFEILERIGKMIYKLALQPTLLGACSIFQMSMLRQYVPNHNHVADYTSLQLWEDLIYDEVPIKIMEKKEQNLRCKTMKYVMI
jgi:hypothetical protein